MHRFYFSKPLFVAALVLVSSAGATSMAQESAPAIEQEQAITQSTAERLDALFAELQRERNEVKAERISRRIWSQWFESGSASIDLLMISAESAIQSRRFSVALDLLDQVTLLEPQYAEGWNRRATLHFMMQQNAKSIADIERTLALEPRHFGALAGLAGILRSQGDNERALEIYLRTLEIYPMMRGAQQAVAQITEELAAEKL